MQRGEPWMSQQPDGTAVAQVSDEVMRKTLDSVAVEPKNGSGGISTDVTLEPSMASPRLIPAPESPPLSVQLPPESTVEDAEQPSASFDRNCAPSQAPVSDPTNHD